MVFQRFQTLFAVTLLAAPLLLQAQESGLATQVLVRADSKANVVPAAGTIRVQVDNKSTPLTSLRAVQPSAVQVALLIDDGLRRSVGVQLSDLKSFVKTLPPGAEILVGYMTNGRVEVLVPFTTDHADAAAKIRLPFGVPGQSASPYFCLSDFVKHWPGASVDPEGGSSPAKARFVMMLTNGVDPYNGSVSPLNQDSPYVRSAVMDAQRAGVTVSSIYYGDSGIRGGAASFSGQSYLQQVSDATGGVAYYEGTGNPVSLSPFLNEFKHAIAETYVATFNANGMGGGREHLVTLKMSTSTPKLKLRHPDEIRPGNRESNDGQ